jgi:hypothetical protein
MRHLYSEARHSQDPNIDYDYRTGNSRRWNCGGAMHLSGAWAITFLYLSIFARTTLFGYRRR